MGNIIFYILIIFLPLGQLGRINRIGEISFLFNDFLIGTVAVSYLIYKFIKKEKIIIDKIYKLIFLFAFVGLASLVVNLSNYALQEIIISSLYLLRFIIYSILYLIFLNEKADMKYFSKIFIYSFTSIAVIGLIQYFFFPDLVSLSQLGWDPHLFRLTAPFLDPAFTGALLCLGLFFIAAKYFAKKIAKKEIFCGVIIYLALAFTYSRAAYMMYVVGMGIIAISKKSPKFILIVLFIGILTVCLLPNQKGYGTNLRRKETVSSRLKNWRNSLYLWQKAPILGHGFNTYRYAQRKYHLLNEENANISNAGAGGDSSLLFVLATTGVIGLAVYIILCIKLLASAFKNQSEFFSLVLFSFLIALIFHSFTANSFFYPFIIECVWILGGLSGRKTRDFEI